MRLRISLPGLGLVLCLSAGALADAPKDAVALAARIDALIEKQWKEKNVVPAAMTDDAEFIRRAYLDLVGRIPPAYEVRKFLESKHADKRLRLVNQLLSEPLYVAHLSTTWRSIILPPNNNQQFQFFNTGFKTWLDKQIKENTPYDKMVREILTVPVGFNPNVRGVQPVQGNAISPAAFYQANELKPENIASTSSRVFLGVKLECAQCHNHPFANWTREQFWQYAAFFSAIQPPQAQRQPVGGRPQPVKQPDGKEIKIAGTEKVVQAKFLDGKKPEWRDNVDPRVILAEWMTSPRNPYFARTAVNRAWAHFFGVGLTDSVDDEPGEDNPISHPELLAELTDQFIAQGFDLKYMIRAIMLSKTYQRTSAMSHESQKEPRTFARMSLKGMTPEQLFDSLAQATGYFEGPGVRNQPAFAFGNNSPRAEFLNRFSSQEKRTETHTSILQALALMNGKFVAEATTVASNSNNPRERGLDRSQTLSAIAEFPGWTTEQRIDALYLTTLSRLPRQEERVRLTAYVDRGGATNNPKQALGDVFWVLLNSSEFILNH